MILIYICFINTIISILINDKINFDIILYGLQNLGSNSYTDLFAEIINSFKNKVTINENENIDNFVYSKMNLMFNKLYSNPNNPSNPSNSSEPNNLKILKLLYDYKVDKDNVFNNFYKIFKNLFTHNFTIECTNPTVIFSNDPNTKLNSSNEQFTKFVNDLEKIWETINQHITANINYFKEKIKEATNSDDLNPTPLLYSSPSIDLCVENKNKYDDEYDKFYNFKKNDSALEFLFQIMTSKSNEEIQKVVQNNETINYGINGFGLEIENSTLVIFTVINITPNPTAPTNNPPTPPFININKLKLIYKIASMPEAGTQSVLDLLLGNEKIVSKITEYGQLFIEKLSKYEFYKDFVELKFKPILGSFDKIIQDKGKILKENIIDFIDSNNATTLLGTVDFEKFTKIRDPTQPYFVCDNKNESLLKQLFDINKIEELLNGLEGKQEENK